jgi:hypothetical protein
MPPARKKAMPAPVIEPDEELEELEVDETDEVEEDEAPKKSAAEEVVFGASDLAKFLSEGREKPITAREIRTLIRKMARDGSGRVNREIIPGNRSRYNWSGPNDPEVKAIIKAFNDGELEADKQAKLQALKDRKTQQKAEAEKKAPAAKKTATKKAAAKQVVVEEDDEELELEDE